MVIHVGVLKGFGGGKWQGFNTLPELLKGLKSLVTEPKTWPISGYVSNLMIPSEIERGRHPFRKWGISEGFWSSSLLQFPGDGFWMHSRPRS